MVVLPACGPGSDGAPVMHGFQKKGVDLRLPLQVSIYFIYRKVPSTSLACFKVQAGFFKLSMKGKFDVYLL